MSNKIERTQAAALEAACKDEIKTRITLRSTEELLKADLSALKAHQSKVLDYYVKVRAAITLRLEELVNENELRYLLEQERHEHQTGCWGGNDPHE